MTDAENINRWIDELTTGEISQFDLAYLNRLMDRNVLLKAESKLDNDIERLLGKPGKVRFLRTLKKIAEKQKKKHSIRPGFLVAAAMLLLVIITTLQWLTDPFSIRKESRPGLGAETQKGSQPKVLTDQNDLSRSGQKDRSLAMNDASAKDRNRHTGTPAFLPNPELEALVGLTMRAPFFKLRQPGDLAVRSAGESLAFFWSHRLPEAITQLEVFDRDGKLIFTSEPMDTTAYTLSTKGWSQGRYYWKLLLNEDLISCGVLVLQ